jgi:hypothetical protein
MLGTTHNVVLVCLELDASEDFEERQFMVIDNEFYLYVRSHTAIYCIVLTWCAGWATILLAELRS